MIILEHSHRDSLLVVIKGLFTQPVERQCMCRVVLRCDLVTDGWRSSLIDSILVRQATDRSVQQAGSRRTSTDKSYIPIVCFVLSAVILLGWRWIALPCLWLIVFTVVRDFW